MSKRIVLGIQVTNRVKKRTERSRLRVFKEIIDQLSNYNSMQTIFTKS
jgi:hypothetical protein